ncbi:EF-hand domain-containing protein [archaeon]|nr:MAG: EF-hand domain-containing protein [archaeon]
MVGATVQGQRLTRKFKKEKLDLLEQVELTLQQRDEKWRKEYMRVYKAYEELEKETVERDYEEFKAPDTNNDDMISRAEFNAYVTKYLSSFPELSEADFPKFDDFDQDEDGLVSFDEWQKFLVQQKLQEAQMKKNDKNNNSAYQELLSSLYEQSNQADSWDSLTKNTPKNGRARRIA